MLDSYRDLIDGLLEMPTRVRDLLGEPVPDDLGADAVSLLRELRVREGVELARIQKVMWERASRLGAIDIEVQQALNNAPADASAERLVSEFGIDRGSLVSILINLTLSDWDRPVDDAELGEITFAEEIERHLDWDEGILERLAADRLSA
jgi:hypothetical protein